jgi:hypothetical protein
MDKKLTSEIFALLLLFIAFPLTSIGTTGGHTAVWWLGLISLVLGGLLPVLTRYMDHSSDKVRDAGIEFDDRTS